MDSKIKIIRLFQFCWPRGAESPRYTMRVMIFQTGFEPFIIQQILIVFEAILEYLVSLLKKRLNKLFCKLYCVIFFVSDLSQPSYMFVCVSMCDFVCSAWVLCG